MRKLLLFAPLVASAVATPANAAALTGRAELKAGYDEPRATIEVFNGESGNFGKGGVAFGAELGADLTIGNGILVGAYGGADLSRAAGCQSKRIRNDPPDQACIKSNRNFYAGLRAGLAVGDSALVYVKGGYSKANFRASYDGVFPAGTPVEEQFEGSGSAGGWHLGGGFEIGVSRAVYVKGEYVYTKYRDALKDDLRSMDLCGAATADCRLRPTRQQVMLGIGLRFGETAARPAPAAVPAPAPVAPAPAEAAAQTCPDGSVIAATASCPAPPPPPPEPVERG